MGVLTSANGIMGVEVQQNLAPAHAVSVALGWFDEGSPFGYSASYKLRLARPRWSLALAPSVSLQPHRQQAGFYGESHDYGRVVSVGGALEGEWRPSAFFLRGALGLSLPVRSEHTSGDDDRPMPLPIASVSAGLAFSLF